MSKEVILPCLNVEVTKPQCVHSYLQLPENSDNCTSQKDFISIYQWLVQTLVDMNIPIETNEQAALLTIMRKNLTSIIEERDNQVRQVRSSMERVVFGKDSEIRSLKADVKSLNSQLSDRMKQIEVLQEAGRLKDQQLQLLRSMNEQLHTKCISKQKKGMDTTIYTQTISELTVQLENKEQQLAQAELKIIKLEQELQYTRQSYQSQTTPYMFDNCTVSTTSKVRTDVCNAEHKQLYLHTLCTSNSDDHTNVNRNDSATQTNDVMNPGSVSQEVLPQLVLQLKSTQEQVAMKEDALNETLKISAKIKQELEEQKDLHTRQSNIITDITTELNHKTIQLLEVDIQRLQTAISEKDASLALLEMKEEVSCVQQRSCDQQEKARLMKELKNKIQEKISLLNKEDKQSPTTHSLLIHQYEEWDSDQVCEAIRILERGRVKIKEYIDQLLALVLDRDPNLLEGLPRIQQNMGMRPNLLHVAALPELIDELREEEEDMYCLQSYAALLIQRINEHSPDLLNSLDVHVT